MSRPTFINLFTRIMVKWLNGTLEMRNTAERIIIGVGEGGPTIAQGWIWKFRHA